MKLSKIALVSLCVVSAAVTFGCGPDEPPAPRVIESPKSENFKPADPAVRQAIEEKAEAEQEKAPKTQKLGSTAAPDAKLPKNGEKVAVIDTNMGRIILKFFPDKAPGHVKNFVKLAEKGFYDGTKFHRVIPKFMIQGGDPNTKTGDGPAGTGGPGYQIDAEFNDTHHARGILSMARSSDPNSAGSQFFICVADAGFLDRQYTAFGQVVHGMDVVDKIVALPRNSQDMPTPGEAVMKKVRIMTWPVKD